MASLKIDVGSLPRDLQEFARGLSAFPAGTQNPLVQWRAAFGGRTLSSARPTVAQAGGYRGNPWPRLKDQYTRKMDGVTVPVWGGVPRLRAGTVTRGGGSLTLLKSLTKAQRAGLIGNPGVTEKGRRTTGGNVLGKLKRDGSRYQSSDPQLGKNLGRSGGLLTDWATSPPIISESGKTVTVTSNVAHAEHVEARRQFSWGESIAREETDDAFRRVTVYLDSLLRKLGQ